MKPADIKEGRTYLDSQDRPYVVKEIFRDIGVKRIRFERNGDEPGRGIWKIQDFAKFMKEEQK